MSRVLNNLPYMMTVLGELFEPIHCCLMLGFQYVKRLSNWMTAGEYSVQSRKPRIDFMKFSGKLFTVRCHGCAFTLAR